MKISLLRYLFFVCYKMSMGLLSTQQAAQRLGVHASRVKVFITEGRLPAQMIGGTYVINEADLALVSDRKPGRPKKPDEGEPDAAAPTPAATPETKARKKASVTAPAAQSKKAAGKGAAASTKPAKKGTAKKGAQQ